VYGSSTHVEQEKGCTYQALATPQLRLWLSTPVEARWKIVTAVTEERLCGETTWFHEFEPMITRNREDLNSKTRNLLEQSGTGRLGKQVIRECVCDCECKAIEFNQICHMNSLCNQRSGCLTRVFQGNFQRLGNFDLPHRLKHLRHSHSRDRRKALWQKQHDFTCSLLSRCVDAPEINVVAMTGAWLGARNGSQFKERS